MFVKERKDSYFTDHNNYYYYQEIVWLRFIDYACIKRLCNVLCRSLTLIFIIVYRSIGPNLPYDMKYWQELNLTNYLFLLFFPRLADYNLADWFRVDTLCEYMQYTLVEFNLTVLSYVHPPIQQINFSTNVSCLLAQHHKAWRYEKNLQ